MSDRPTITTLPSGGRYNTSTLNTNFTALRNYFDNVIGRAGTGGSNNTATNDLDMNTNDIRNVGAVYDTSGNDILANSQVGYAEEWAIKAEDNLVSVAAGGDGATEYSSLHWSAKAEEHKDAAAADLVLTNADTVLTNADVVLTNADVVLTNADVVTAGNSETAAAASASAAAASAAGIFWKEPVVNATTANITLSGEQTIDGILTSTSRILVKNQSDASENGAYVTAAGAWARAAPLDTWNEHVGAAVIVSSGSVHGDSAWICTVDAGGTLETTAITWAALSQVYTSATATTEGIIELATLAEVATGSDTSRAVTAAGAAAHYSPEARTITADTSTALNSALTHEGGVVTMNNASANVFTIEPNATIAHSTGAQIDVIMLGAGVTSITGDTGVTLNGVSAGTGAMTAQYGAVTLLRISSDVWTASGAIGTVA